MPALTGSWARCVEGLRHPHTGKTRPITFDHAIAKGRDDVVLIHLNHRLVQMCLRLMRAEVWAQRDVKKLNCVDVRGLPKADLDDIAVVVVSRLVVTGGNHHRLHEELTVSGGLLKDGSFVRETRVTQVDAWLEKAAGIMSEDRLFEGLQRRFEKHRDLSSKPSRLIARSVAESRKHVGEPAKARGEHIAAVLDELARAIEDELRKEKEPQQLSLFSEDERTQLRRDIEALKLRLVRIPEEKKQEIEAIERRFAGYQVKTFPAAVIFLVPEGHPWRSAT